MAYDVRVGGFINGSSGAIHCNLKQARTPPGTYFTIQIYLGAKLGTLGIPVLWQRAHLAPIIHWIVLQHLKEHLQTLSTKYRSHIDLSIHTTPDL